MSESVFFGIAVFVFAVLVIGLVLTIAEFRHGEPREQAERAKRRRRGGESNT